jgi:hypothetical protein
VELALPPVEEVGDGGGLHVTHVSELGGLLGVQHLAVSAEDCEGRNTLLEGNAVLFGDINVLVEVANVNVDQEKILFEEIQIRRLMQIDVEHLAVAAPVATKVEDDALMLKASLLEGSGDVGCGIGVGAIEVFFDSRRSGDRHTLRRFRRGCFWSGRIWLAAEDRGRDEHRNYDERRAK